ncbi:MAG: bacterial regulatory s, tetR family protein [Novosphingobium sp.]|nr:bacterial regulatory s, tetR family protein [Novosphingobium sp.]
MSAPTNPPELPSKQRTIARVLKAARAAFSTHGLAGARVDEIARAAGFTKQLVYQFFDSKEKLFACVLDESAEDNLAALLATDFDHLAPREALRAALNQAFDLYRDDQTLGPLAQQGLHFHEGHALERRKFNSMAPALVAKLGRILQRGVQSGDFRAGVDAQMCLAIAALVTTGAFTNRLTVMAIAGLDTRSARGMAAWREYSADFIFAALARGEPPSLRRPTVLNEPEGPVGG